MRTDPEDPEPRPDHVHVEPVDPDVSLDVPAQRRELGPAVLAAIALGGGLGGLARYGLSGVIPGPWGFLLINVLGSALIGVLMVLVPRLHPLARPFLGVGVLGGFTTFSTYALDAVHLGASAFVYLFGTLFLALGATFAAMALTRKVFG
ncbi:CrcB protein [Saccharothrix ecbatanensis]|uniref:Fluoride-specific ion channel FluC n=1 Tax=Saccharothrix ecbatanensis TaxID=1105145 RepID=A0A7W9M5Q9_9PSEU|nr:CrcB family protein [Saccharothrix ecbatanensis]MBB5808390.1 CrcB protein [Saccharothrix ecbatanensis]